MIQLRFVPHEPEVPKWPTWEGGKPVSVTPPIEILSDEEGLVVCPRIAYDGGVWFLYDEYGKVVLYTQNGEFPLEGANWRVLGQQVSPTQTMVKLPW